MRELELADEPAFRLPGSIRGGVREEGCISEGVTISCDKMQIISLKFQSSFLE